jgi:hypothetical protein
LTMSEPDDDWEARMPPPPLRETTGPQTYFTEQATMQLRWNNGVLEQAFYRTASGRGETVWRAVPSIGGHG